MAFVPPRSSSTLAGSSAAGRGEELKSKMGREIWNMSVTAPAVIASALYVAGTTRSPGRNVIDREPFFAFDRSADAILDASSRPVTAVY